jgi:hypothetical protein
MNKRSVRLFASAVLMCTLNAGVRSAATAQQQRRVYMPMAFAKGATIGPVKMIMTRSARVVGSVEFVGSFKNVGIVNITDVVVVAKNPAGAIITGSTVMSYSVPGEESLFVFPAGPGFGNINDFSEISVESYVEVAVRKRIPLRALVDLRPVSGQYVTVTGYLSNYSSTVVKGIEVVTWCSRLRESLDTYGYAGLNRQIDPVAIGANTEISLTVGAYCEPSYPGDQLVEIAAQGIVE